MGKLAVTLLAGTGALFVGSGAIASDIYTSSEYASPDMVQQFVWSVTKMDDALAPAAAAV